MRSGKELVGIGIDIISWSRIERFLAAHPLKSLKRLLSPSEQKAIRRARSIVQFFGRCFTAKEAYFKACGLNAMGEADLARIETQRKRGNWFRVSSRFFSSGRGLRSEGKFFETPNGIGAQVLLWRGETK